MPKAAIASAFQLGPCTTSVRTGDPHRPARGDVKVRFSDAPRDAVVVVSLDTIAELRSMPTRSLDLAKGRRSLRDASGRLTPVRIAVSVLGLLGCRRKRG